MSVFLGELIPQPHIPSTEIFGQTTDVLRKIARLSISDRGYVLVTGENRYSGSGKELLNDPRVRSSFLGG